MLWGALGALAFPLVVPQLGTLPCLDAWPRECAIGIVGAAMFAAADGTGRLRDRALGCTRIGVGYFAVLLHWLDVPLARYGGLPQALAIPLLLALVLFCAAFWSAIPWTAHMLRQHARLSEPVSFACAVVCVEWVRGESSGFPWGVWGYSQARNLPWLQLASVAGVHGLTWLLAYLSASGVLAWRRRSVRHAAVSLSVAVLATGLGLWLEPSKDGASDPVVVSVVQPNINQDIKNGSGAHRDAIETTLADLSAQAGNAMPAFLVWPEAAVPGFVPWQASRLPIGALGVPLLTGISAFTADAPPRLYNASAWLDAEGFVLSTHAKRHLVPFGEYVPLRWLLPVQRLVPGSVDASPGTSDAPLGTPPLGVLICYDGVFPQPARATVSLGAQLLINLTNDAWYGKSSGPFQHLEFYPFRAVESRRWLVRAANTGVSAFIDPAGRVVARSELGSTAVLTHAVRPASGTTFYGRTGEWLVATCLGAVGGACVVYLAALRRFC